MNIIRGVNAIAWADNVDIKLLVWCDITTKILIGFTLAVPLSAFCLVRQLEQVSSGRQTFFTHEDRKRRMIIEAVLCFGVPVIFMGLHYIVQGHRFDIIEGIGCSPATYISVPAVILIWVPPLVISSVSMIYAIATFHHFLKRRIEFATVLQSSAISPARYLRLMSLAVFEIFWDTGTNIYILYFNTYTGLQPWISWESVHLNFSRVDQYPDFLVPAEFQIQIIVQWWIIPISSVAFCLLFGFGQEATNDYLAMFNWVRRHIFLQKVQSDVPTSTILPMHRSLGFSKMDPPPFSSSSVGFKEKDSDSSSQKSLSPEFSEASTLPHYSRIDSFVSTMSINKPDVSDFSESLKAGSPIAENLDAVAVVSTISAEESSGHDLATNSNMKSQESSEVNSEFGHAPQPLPTQHFPDASSPHTSSFPTCS